MRENDKSGSTSVRLSGDSDLTFTGVPTMTISANVEPSLMTFRAIGGKEVLKIDAEGKLIPGEGLSMDEVTQGVFAALQETLPQYKEIERLRKENARMRAALEKIAVEGSGAFAFQDAALFQQMAREALFPK